MEADPSACHSLPLLLLLLLLLLAVTGGVEGVAAAALPRHFFGWSAGAYPVAALALAAGAVGGAVGDVAAAAAAAALCEVRLHGRLVAAAAAAVAFEIQLPELPAAAAAAVCEVRLHGRLAAAAAAVLHTQRLPQVDAKRAASAALLLGLAAATHASSQGPMPLPTYICAVRYCL